jgi:uncharacterized protein
MTAVDPIATWSSLLALPAAPKTGVIVTPQAAPIRPVAGIGHLWGDDEPIFEDDAQIDAALGAVALRYNALIRDLDRSLERLEADHIVDYRPRRRGRPDPARLILILRKLARIREAAGRPGAPSPWKNRPQ